MDVNNRPSEPPTVKDGQKNQQDIERWLKARGEERAIKRKRDAELQREKAKRRQKCAQLRNDLRDFEQGGVVWYDLDESGKRRYYSEEDVQKEITDLKKTIKRHCPR